jgi:RNA polymerase sigma-70 factor, ECF subfamily
LASDKELSDFLKSVEKRAFKRTVYAVRDDDAALDIVQDTMIRLAEKYFDRPAAELPLLFTRILSNATMDWFRRKKVRNNVLKNFSDFEGPGEDGDFDIGKCGGFRLSGPDPAINRLGSTTPARSSTRGLPAALLGRT